MLNARTIFEVEETLQAAGRARACLPLSLHSRTRHIEVNRSEYRQQSSSIIWTDGTRSESDSAKRQGGSEARRLGKLTGCRAAEQR